MKYISKAWKFSSCFVTKEWCRWCERCVNSTSYKLFINRGNLQMNEIQNFEITIIMW